MTVFNLSKNRSLPRITGHNIRKVGSVSGGNATTDFANRLRSNRWTSTGASSMTVTNTIHWVNTRQIRGTNSAYLEYLIVAAGGGGGCDMGGGGGGGGVYNFTTSDPLINTATSETLNVSVGGGGGGGGPGTNGPRGGDGGSSSITGTSINLTATGGGGGASDHDTNSYPAGNGGCGGGGSGGRYSAGNYGGAAGSGIAGQGYSGQWSYYAWYPGGGGGASQAGFWVPAGGGKGRFSNIVGAAHHWGGGGGGAGYSGSGGDGGIGGGGAGAVGGPVGGGRALNAGANSFGGGTNTWANTPGSPAGANTGGGGGGGAHYQSNNQGGQGGTGIVVVRYYANTGTSRPGDGRTQTTPGVSAWQILQDFPESKDGIYWIQMGSGVYGVYCDMTTDGGGWMRVMNGGNTGGVQLAGITAAVGNPATERGKYSDSDINWLIQNTSPSYKVFRMRVGAGVDYFFCDADWNSNTPSSTADMPNGWNTYADYLANPIGPASYSGGQQSSNYTYPVLGSYAGWGNQMMSPMSPSRDAFYGPSGDTNDGEIYLR